MFELLMLLLIHIFLIKSNIQFKNYLYLLLGFGFIIHLIDFQKMKISRNLDYNRFSKSLNLE
jgi:hypothetical protein